MRLHATLSVKKSLKQIEILKYRVSQQVWDRLRNVGERSEHRLQKNCISLQKIAFSAFYPELQK